MYGQFISHGVTFRVAWKKWRLLGCAKTRCPKLLWKTNTSKVTLRSSCFSDPFASYDLGRSSLCMCLRQGSTSLSATTRLRIYASPLMGSHVHTKQPNQLGLTGRTRQVSIKTRIRVSKKNRKGIAWTIKSGTFYCPLVACNNCSQWKFKFRSPRTAGQQILKGVRSPEVVDRTSHPRPPW